MKVVLRRTRIPDETHLICAETKTHTSGQCLTDRPWVEALERHRGKPEVCAAAADAAWAGPIVYHSHNAYVLDARLEQGVYVLHAAQLVVGERCETDELLMRV